MTDLIKRIDDYMQGAGEELATVILNDCKAEIQRLLTANEALKGLCEEYQAQIKAQGEYVPTTDEERKKMMRDWYNDKTDHTDLTKYLEAEVIKRAGLVVKDSLTAQIGGKP